MCGDVCADLQSDPAHCGDCGTACADGQYCLAGACADSCPLTDCSGACVDTSLDASHCGDCGTSCASDEQCVAGSCTLVCPTGQNACGTDCADFDTDPAHCGGCDTACADGQYCVAGACADACPLTDCSGACVDTSVDASHCGDCGTSCGTDEQCVDGSCALVCPSGQNACGTDCADFDTDPAHCGGCDTACADGQYCLAGACTDVCPLTDCGGTCVDTNDDPNHCGTCDTSCAAGDNQAPVCAAGRCATTCDVGYGDCNFDGTDGCETGLDTEATCGSCAVSCGGAEHCVASRCSCAPASVSPAPYALGVDPATAITLTPSCTLDASTATAANVHVWGSLGGTVSGTVSVGSSGELVFTPDAALQRGERVTVDVFGVSADDGRAVRHIWQFDVAVASMGGMLVEDTSASTGGNESRGVRAGDVNGDGLLDVVLADESDQSQIIRLGTSGDFSAGTSFGSGHTIDLALADFDGDGDLDAFLANRNSEPNEVWLNDGSGTFTSTGQALGTRSSDTARAADMDGDGDLDVVVGNRSGDPSVVWLNDGSGTFTEGATFSDSHNNKDLVLADLDLDGDLDVVEQNWSGQNSVFLNDGRGNLTESSNLGSNRTVAGRGGDMNGDGAIDIVACVPGTSGGVEVWTNDGAGSFSLAQTAPVGSTAGCGALTVGDLDGDGDLDVAASSDSDTGENGLLTNDGGSLTAASTFSTTTRSDLVLGDFDGDGDLDMFASDGGTNGYYRNDSPL